MNEPLAAPPANAPPEKLADWLELSALRAVDLNVSMQDLVATIGRSGSIEAVVEEDDTTSEDAPIAEYVDTGSERANEVAADAFGELEDRHEACGGESGGYPFELGERHLQVTKDFDASTYAFFLLIAHFGKDAGPAADDGARLFEELCFVATQRYLGCGDAGKNGAHSGGALGAYRFGWPRPDRRGFRRAINRLCEELGEGIGCSDDPTLDDQKDGSLDLAVWNPFPDGRVGKLIVFGQCASGKHWRSKTMELDPRKFSKNWLQQQPAVEPIPLFLSPFRVGRREWRRRSNDAGVVVDRCRLAWLTADLPEDLRKRVVTWSQHVLQECVRDGSIDTAKAPRRRRRSTSGKRRPAGSDGRRTSKSRKARK